MFDLGNEFKDIANGLMFAAIAGVGGSVAYLSSIMGNKKRFVWSDFLIKGISSAFAGLIISWIMIYYQYPVTIIGAVSGTAGYIGAEFTINALKRFILNRVEMSTNNSKRED